jgi:hypothetical protein
MTPAGPPCPFLDAVAAQVAGHRAVGAADADTPLDGARASARAVIDAPDLDRAARLLLRDPPLFAAFFQNADLAFEKSSQFGNHISARVMRALELIGPNG